MSITFYTVGRTESLGVGGQTVTLVSRTSGPSAALNLATPGPISASGPSVRTVTHPSGVATNNAIVTSSSAGHLAYHIPRGAAAVANMAAPKSQTVATPMVRTTGQPPGQPTTLPGPLVSVYLCFYCFFSYGDVHIFIDPAWTCSTLISSHHCSSSCLHCANTLALIMFWKCITCLSNFLRCVDSCIVSCS